MTPAPQISVVIASIVGEPFIDDCLASVFAQEAPPAFEVIVVDCRGAENVARLRSRFPAVRFVELPARESVPRLRRIGVEHATADIVAIVEEHCVVAPNWLATVSRTLTRDYGVVGGPILDDGYARIQDWVTYFIEYGSWLPPWSDGPTSFVNGANVAYRRDLLMAHRAMLDDGYWEATLHPTLLTEGMRFRSVPAMAVRHRGPFDYFYYLRQRYWFSRAYAGSRSGSVSRAGRLAYLMAAPVVPVLLLARLATRVVRKRHRVGRFVLSLPLLFVALCVYAAGEWMGYAFGAGRALMEVE